MKWHRKTHVRASISGAITAALKRIFGKAVEKPDETVSVYSDEADIPQTIPAYEPVETSKPIDVAKPIETSESRHQK